VKQRPNYTIIIFFVLLSNGIGNLAFAQLNVQQKKIQKASKKVESGYTKNNPDTLAQGYFDLGESYYQKGELKKSEGFYQKSKDLYEKMGDADGVAKSSRALAKVQEDQNKTIEALGNYNTAKDNSIKSQDVTANSFNVNDIKRLSHVLDTNLQQGFLLNNIKLGMINKDTNEIVSGYSMIGNLNLSTRNTSGALDAFKNAYKFSRGNAVQAQRYNQQVTDIYLEQKNFSKAIETKKVFLGEGFVQSSSELKAKEITSLADIYIKKKEDSTAIRLLKESYTLSVANGHTLEARTSLEKLDSIYQSTGQTVMSLPLYKDFLSKLPAIIGRDSSLVDERIISQTESKIKELESEKALKDVLIRRKNVFNYWLLGSVIVLVLFTITVLYMLKRLRIKNKKIALQSLRREMNPHFIFNSLNSINQFIATNNELEANQYLTKFSTLMRRVMENSKDDFVLFVKEIELLQNYLELEKSRFTDKFDYDIKIDDSLFAEENIYMPGMLVQPYLENAVWHGLRYMDKKGMLQLTFARSENDVLITIEDNGIGIAESKRSKTENQKKRSGRGINNTLERIKILNELYHQHIRCTVEDKTAPASGVKVTITAPLLKNFKNED
jgi:tetratricopeptide (TPR) repeat protein